MCSAWSTLSRLLEVWDSRVELGPRPEEGAEDFLRRTGADGLVRVVRTRDAYHLSMVGRAMGASAPELTLEPDFPNRYHGASEYGGRGGDPREDSVTPRVSFAPSIERALVGLAGGAGGDGARFNVYVPVSESEFIVPAGSPHARFAHEPTYDGRNRLYVADAAESGELWAIHPIRVRLAGVVDRHGRPIS